MHFLPDVYVPCDVCHGKRYNRETLEIRYKGKNIPEVLDMTVEDALQFFSARPGHRAASCRRCSTWAWATSRWARARPRLSGGEAQRVKLVAGAVQARHRAHALHPGRADHRAAFRTTSRKLLEVLHRLRDQGNTVVVIEHNLDVIKTADWIVDLGPEGGEGGGRIIAEGTPAAIARNPKSVTGEYLKKMMRK